MREVSIVKTEIWFARDVYLRGFTIASTVLQAHAIAIRSSELIWANRATSILWLRLRHRSPCRPQKASCSLLSKGARLPTCALRCIVLAVSSHLSEMRKQTVAWALGPLGRALSARSA